MATITEGILALYDLISRVQDAPRPVVMHIAETYRDYVSDVVLRRYQHAERTWTTSPRNTGSPAWVTGNLARSIRARQGPYTENWAMASVGPYIVYGRIQELGGEIKGNPWLHWQNISPETGQLTDWFMKRVDLPPRPYLSPAATETVDRGLLTAAAVSEFLAQVWG